MKKRVISLLLALVLAVSLLPTAAWAAGTTFDDYFVKASLPATATNYSGYNKWKVITKDGEEVLKNGSLYSRGDNYGIPRVNSDRIKIFHAAHCDYISRLVADNFKFNFLPSCDVSFHKHLSNRGEHKTVFSNDFKLFFIICNTASCTA